MRGTAIDRFLAKVVKTPKGCWEWLAYKDEAGYGIFSLTGQPDSLMKAHRASYVLLVGEIPDGLWVLHRCDNPPCTNPDHLFLGTPKDNSADRDRKGRAANQQPGYVSPKKGKSKYPVCDNGVGKIPSTCTFCHQSYNAKAITLGKYKNGNFCSRSCKTKHFHAIGILSRRNKKCQV